MKIGLVAQQKDGDGTTSTIVHVAFDFYERGLRVAVVELDTQGNASSTLRRFTGDYAASWRFEPGVGQILQAFNTLPEGPLLCLITAEKELANTRKFEDAAPPFRANIEALADCGFDVVLIDTAPALNVSLATALNAAGCVLSPIRWKHSASRASRRC
jgi:chromosome partitioning protein